jgi:hypothetical protein
MKQAVNNSTYNSFRTIQVNEYILNELKERYSESNFLLTKEDLADVLNLSPRTISNRMSSGSLDIKFIKLDNSKQGGILFPLVAVAEYLTERLCSVA